MSGTWETKYTKMYYFLSVRLLRNQTSTNVCILSECLALEKWMTFQFSFRHLTLISACHSGILQWVVNKFVAMPLDRQVSRWKFELWWRCQNSQEKNIFGNWLSSVHQARCSWLLYSNYLYLDFCLCSMTKLKGHSRGICWPRWEYKLWWRCKNKSEPITWIWPDGLTRVKCVVSCCV